jgi:hypothetical protein
MRVVAPFSRNAVLREVCVALMLGSEDHECAAVGELFALGLVCSAGAAGEHDRRDDARARTG